jgi:prefoldin subunit 5
MRSGVGVIEKSLVDPIAFFNPNSIKGIDKLTSLTSGIRKISKDISKFVKLSGANVPGYLKWTDNMAKASADFSKELLDGTNDAAGFAQRIALQHVITSMAGLNRSINSANSQLKDLNDSKKESEAFNNFLIKGSIEDQLGDLGDLNKKLNILHKYISAIPSSSELNTDIRKLSSKLATTTTASKYGSVIKEKLPTVTIPYNSRTYKILDGSSSTTTKRSTNLLSTK